MRNDYSIFAEFLRNYQGENIQLSFKQIELIIQRRLPLSAYKFESWWANSDNNPFMKKVLKVGWVKTNVEMLSEFVEFEQKFKPKLLPTSSITSIKSIKK